jgi:hypothetical protein
LAWLCVPCLSDWRVLRWRKGNRRWEASFFSI